MNEINVNIFDKKIILSKMKDLVRNECKYTDICRVILKNQDCIEKYNINEISKLCYSSPASIVRACKYLGLKGFKELISILKQVNVEPNKTNKFDIFEILEDTNNLINIELLQKLAKKIHSKEFTVMFVAIGESYAICQIFKNRLMKLGIRTNVFNEMENIYSLIKNGKEKILVIALSVSGETLFVNDSIEIFNQHRINTYSITGYRPNKLNKLCKNNFYIAVNPKNNLNISRENIQSFFFVLDRLFEAIISNDVEYYKNILINK